MVNINQFMGCYVLFFLLSIVYISTMQNKKEMLMILVAIIGITLLYRMVLSVPTSKCGREGLENTFGEEVLSVIESNKNSSGETTTPDAQLDNYNSLTKSGIPTVFYAPDSSTARITVTNSEDDVTGTDKKTYSITVTSANGATTTYIMENPNATSSVINPLTNLPEPVEGSSQVQLPTVPDSIANTRFVDKDGNIAKLYVAPNGQYVVQTRQINGYDMVYTSTNVFTYDRNNAKSFLVGDTVNDITPIGEAQNTTNSLINSLTNNTISSQQAQTINGIPGRMIPAGQEDLYILKSQVVPPVCPRCPTICAGKNTKETCPPCPSCARCPESTDFTCKKVPDYSTSTAGSTGGDSMWGPDSSSSISSSNGANGAITNGISPSYNQYDKYRNNSKFSPVPVVSSFSTFGM